MDEHHFVEEHRRQLVILSLTLAVVAVLFFNLYMRFVGSADSREMSSSSQSYTTISQTTTTETGLLRLMTSSGKNTVSYPDPITLIAYATAPTNTVGYDAVISFDPTLVSYVSADSLLEDFDIIEIVEEGIVYITGIKKLQSVEPITLDHTPVAIITFGSLKQGSATFDLEFTPGDTNNSNLIDENSKYVLGSVEGTTVGIE